MPFVIKKKQNCYYVVNEDTGKMHSFCSTKENAQKQKNLLNAIKYEKNLKMRGGGDKAFEDLPAEQVLDFLKTLEIKELVRLCSVNKKYSKICKRYSKEIFKNTLDKFKVNYMDKSNFIYISNDADIDDYITEEYIDYYGIFKLYGNFYYDKSITFIKRYDKKDITSFPVFPHMEKCTIHFTSIVDFPTQPRMTYCNLIFNKIENFNVQPKMTHCIVSNNRLINFVSQPSLETLKARFNSIERFDIQPKMIECIIENNQIKDLQIQPRMKILLASNNLIQNLQTQPEMFGCDLQSCNLQTVEPQPRMLCCNFSRNLIREFTNHESLIIADLSFNSITTMQQIEYYNVQENPIYESLSEKNSSSVIDIINFFILSFKSEKDTLKNIIDDFVASTANDFEQRAWFEENTDNEDNETDDEEDEDEDD